MLSKKAQGSRSLDYTVRTWFDERAAGYRVEVCFGHGIPAVNVGVTFADRLTAEKEGDALAYLILKVCKGIIEAEQEDPDHHSRANPG